MKNICFLIGDINHSGGTERVTTLIANTLDENHHNVFLLSMSSGDNPFFELNKDINVQSLFKEKLSMKRHFPQCVKRIRRFLIDNKIDTLVVVDSISCVFTVPACIGIQVNHSCLEHLKLKVTLGSTVITICRCMAARILDNIVKADIGIGATRLNGDVKQFGTSVDIDEYSPIIYAEVGAKLPFTGLSAKAEATYTNVNDVKITDAQAEFQYDFVKSIALDLGAKVGYRVLNIELNDLDKRDMKFNFKGPYIGLNAHF